MRRTIRQGSLGAVAVLGALAIILSGCAASGGGTTTSASSSCTPKGGAAPRAGGAKYIVYMSALNIGNAWQEAAANLGTAEAKMDPYVKCVEVRKELTEPTPDAQISQIQSMVAAGADAIVTYPLSPTAINSAYKDACKQGVAVVSYDATVTEPCVYNVSYITSKPEGSDKRFMGYNSMDLLAGLMGGKGDIIVGRGILGTSTDLVHYNSSLAALKKYPNMKIVTQYEGKWNSAQTKTEVTKALASFPNVNGLWCGYGESGCVKALIAGGKKIPVSGETSQFFREQLLLGWPGVSIGSPPAQGGIAMKVALAVLLNGAKGIPLDIEVPYKIVTAKNVSVCKEDTYTDGCNVFAPGTVGDEDTADIFNVMLPESSLISAKTGTPPPALKATVYTVDYLKRFEEDKAVRLVTRGACTDGWSKTTLPEGVEGCKQG